MEVQYEITISGKVQGVGFRYFVQKQASELNVSGWVRNMPDGRVMAVARGEETDVQTFMDHLRVGPSMARIKEVTTVKSPNLEHFDGFKIKF